jgi:predicted GTPase
MRPLRSAPNPFDFANPVSDVELLAGRENQLKEAEYYIDQFTVSDEAINLALLGERAAGKTSLLNAIAGMAHKRELIVARIDLTEGDVESPLHFWFKTFDEALSATVQAGGFDGETSPFYDGYLRTVSGHGDVVPEEYRI